jgi:hypothetical protein
MKTIIFAIGIGCLAAPALAAEGIGSVSEPPPGGAAEIAAVAR